MEEIVSGFLLVFDFSHNLLRRNNAPFQVFPIIVCIQSFHPAILKSCQSWFRQFFREAHAVRLYKSRFQACPQVCILSAPAARGQNM